MRLQLLVYEENNRSCKDSVPCWTFLFLLLLPFLSPSIFLSFSLPLSIYLSSRSFFFASSVLTVYVWVCLGLIVFPLLYCASLSLSIYLSLFPSSRYLSVSLPLSCILCFDPVCVLLTLFCLLCFEFPSPSHSLYLYISPSLLPFFFFSPSHALCLACSVLIHCLFRSFCIFSSVLTFCFFVSVRVSVFPYLQGRLKMDQDWNSWKKWTMNETCLILYSFWAGLLQSLIMRWIVSSLSTTQPTPAILLRIINFCFEILSSYGVFLCCY